MTGASLARAIRTPPFFTATFRKADVAGVAKVIVCDNEAEMIAEAAVAMEFGASAEDLAACLESQGVALRPGDILLVRLGWVQAFLAEEDPQRRAALFQARTYSGLSGGEDTWRFVWEHRLAALASDSVTVELWPPHEGRPCLHLAIPPLGLPIG